MYPLQIICTDRGHEKEDRHVDPGGVRDVRGRRVRGHPLRVPLHHCASGARLEAQREARGVPSHGLSCQRILKHLLQLEMVKSRKV